MFSTEFPLHAMEGDTITCTLPCGMVATARLYRDDSGDSPTDRDDGFWPSLNPKAAGYIGPKAARALAKHMKRAEQTMAAWENDEWYYCGVAVTITRNGGRLTDEFLHALWGIECNYPSTGKRHPNAYLRTVANELLSEAITSANERIDDLCSEHCEGELV
jgi:hypothetical protein